MKRSDMIDTIKETMNAYHPIDLNDEEVAESILTTIESMGMLPPDVCIKKEFVNKFEEIYDSKKHAAHFHMNKSLYYWEEE